MVFAEAVLGFADGSDDAGLEVVQPSDVVDDVAVDRRGVFGGERVEKEGVDGEVAAFGVLGFGGELDGVGAAVVGVVAVTPERGDLDALALARADDDDAEVGPDVRGGAEELCDLLGSGVGGDVVIGRVESEDLVADASAGKERAEAGALECADDLDRLAPGQLGVLWGCVCAGLRQGRLLGLVRRGSVRRGRRRGTRTRGACAG